MVAKTFIGIILFALGAFLMGCGLLFLAWTVFTAFSILIGPAWAGLSASVLILLGGGICIWIGKKSLK
jgi:hypothetical protein